MTIFDYIELHAKERPKATVFHYDNKSITYKDLYNILAENQQTGHRYRNKVVLLKNKTVFEFVLTFLFLLSENCMVIPIADEVNKLEVQELLTNIDYVLINKSLLFHTDFSDSSNQDYKLSKPNGTKAGIYHATSGTTGMSKLCIRSLDNLTKEGLAYKDCLQLMPSDKIISLSPLHHSYAMGVALMGTLVSGASLYLVDKVSPRKAIRNIFEYKITILILVPAIAKIMCEVKRREKHPFLNVRIALAGAGVVSPELYYQFYSEFGSYLMSNYGSTETGGLLTRLEDDNFPGLGKPMKGVQIKICTNGALDNYGELYVKSEAMFRGYVHYDSEVFDSEGFYAMGDYVSKDEYGNLYYKGRKKNIINIGGKKICPEEVETVICNFPGVKECIVLESQRKNQNSISVAFVIAEHNDSKGLYRHCVKYLTNYKVPSVFRFIEEFPRNEMGKIKYNDLKAMLNT